ncbi:MAG TPA: carbonic anhydrase family protein [Aquabacterium sp.]|uniref:carbonic anhydrase n=1 Tax=Aquabacterium sp. TaxID=1872578 RepID=UPI002E3718EA|nr:carbonic anhydrase family protein [Aquabacterium sp.]HEX5357223.1 carbonic anhydrase family protein [Aquabacterium sp.]
MMDALRVRLAQVFTLAASMALVMGAYAADGHGHGDAPADGGDAKEASIKPSLKPNLKAEAQNAEGRRAEGRSDERASEPRGESARKGEGRGEARDNRREAPSRSESASDARSNVSMAELRDLIDQKIAEVRTKREPAPVVRLRPKPVTKARPAPGHGAVATNDAHGALLPQDPHGVPGGKAGAGSHSPNPNGHDVHWAYSGDTGPESWGRLKPEFQQCMLGKRQSPIDIREGIPVQLDPIQFDYRPSNFRVIDNGHTVQVNVEPGNGITVMGRRYELLQFHFHRPSEERINGRQYEMVAHLVHKDMDGKLAVVAVLMDQGKAHPVVQQVWNNLPLEKNSEQGALSQIDLSQLLPEQRQYYTYMGSLTTPPCSEGVLWMVMKQPAGISREQIGVFSKLYPMNARPVQSAAGRLIKDGQ